MPTPLDDSIQYLKYVGPSRAEDFARLGINTVRDLIWTFPRDMSDRSHMHTIAGSPEEQPVTIVASAVSVTERAVGRRRWRTPGGRKPPTSITTAEFTDGLFQEIFTFKAAIRPLVIPGSYQIGFLYRRRITQYRPQCIAQERCQPRTA